MSEIDELRRRVAILEKRLDDTINACNAQSAIFKADLVTVDKNFAALIRLLETMSRKP